jgi:hypothetical protein
MDTIKDSVRAANAAWIRGQDLERSGDLLAAHACYRLAHDLVVDCPKMHAKAHRRLKQINLKRRSYRALSTDLLLLGLSPVGIFELIAYLMKGHVIGSVLCQRKGA